MRIALAFLGFFLEKFQMKIRNLFLLPATVFGLSVMIGCNDPSAAVSFEVKIIHDGQSVDKALITLMPMKPDGNSAGMKPGVTDANGIAKLSAPKGEYKVLVSKNESAMASVSMDPKDMGKDMTKNMGKAMMGKNTLNQKGEGSSGPKGLLPAQFGVYDKTTLKITVPTTEKVVTFDLGK